MKPKKKNFISPSDSRPFFIPSEQSLHVIEGAAVAPAHDAVQSPLLQSLPKTHFLPTPHSLSFPPQRRPPQSTSTSPYCSSTSPLLQWMSAGGAVQVLSVWQ
jgi:hypothetical protein